MNRVTRTLAIAGLALAAVGGGTASAQTPTPPTPPPDTTRPELRWEAPTRGATVRGFLWSVPNLPGATLCQVRASDNVGIARIEFVLDTNTKLNTELNAPYNCIFDSTTVKNGPHQLTATAYDAAGNSRRVDVGFFVDNPTTDVVRPVVLPPTVEASPAPPTAQAVPAPTPVVAPPTAVVTPPAVLMTPPAGRDNSPPRVSFSARPISTRLLRGRGLTVPVRCNEACDVVLSLYYRGQRVGAGRGSLNGAGRRQLTVRLSNAGKRRLRRTRRGVVLLRGVATDTSGQRRVISRRVRLRR